MIYEFRTYNLLPRTQPEFLKRFGEKLPERQKMSRLAAFWTTEIGPLNQVIHVWEYDNVQQRSQTRAEAVKRGIWPPQTMDFISEMQSDILEPLPFSPALSPSNHGPWFEMRSYVLKAGGGAEMAKRWEEYLPGRLKLSPLIGVFQSDIGKLSQWVHIWAYKSLDERLQIRRRAAAEGIWPPPGDSPVLKQETKLMLAAPFSPIQ